MFYGWRNKDADMWLDVRPRLELRVTIGRRHRAGVRVPGPVCVPLAQWIEHQISNLIIAGSSPARDTISRVYERKEPLLPLSIFFAPPEVVQPAGHTLINIGGFRYDFA